MNTFDKIIQEQYSTLKNTKVMRFPRQINFSEEFIESVKKEYYTQTLNESPEAPVRNRPEKFLKAMKFVIEDVVRNEETEKPKYIRPEENLQED